MSVFERERERETDRQTDRQTETESLETTFSVECVAMFSRHSKVQWGSFVLVMSLAASGT